MSTPQLDSHPHQALGWDDAIERYSLHLTARNHAQRTVYSYRLELLKLRDHLQALHVAPDRVTLDQLRHYVAGLLTGETSRTQRPISIRTVHRVTTTLRGFFAWLHEEGLIADDPARRLESPRLPQPLPGHVLSRDEVERLIKVPDVTTPDGLRDRALWEVLYATGLRRSEALALDLGDLDARERVIYVRHGKGDKGRVVPLTRSAWSSLRDYLDHARPALASAHADSACALFLSGRGTRFHHALLRRQLLHHGELAGLDPLPTPHALRRSCATHLLKAGVSLRHIQLLLGHVNLSTTAVYLRLDASELRRELLLKHPREGLEA